jgi:ABC-type transport system involved in cytochrome bd biosynthesis fused ATPase/permease subunit
MNMRYYPTLHSFRYLDVLKVLLLSRFYMELLLLLDIAIVTYLYCWILLS